jgi:hypothetical protein
MGIPICFDVAPCRSLIGIAYAHRVGHALWVDWWSQGESNP